METVQVKVRGYHLDLYGHVNNARYLEFLEEGRWDYFEKTSEKDELHSRGLGFVIVNNNINYRFPAKLNQKLDVKTEVAKIGTKSITFKQEIYLSNTDTIVLDALVIFVIMDFKTGKAIEITEELKTLLGH